MGLNMKQNLFLWGRKHLGCRGHLKASSGLAVATVGRREGQAVPAGAGGKESSGEENRTCNRRSRCARSVSPVSPTLAYQPPRSKLIGPARGPQIPLGSVICPKVRKVLKDKA